MNNQEAYNEWSAQYDTVNNKTRDIEARVIREILAPLSFEKILELGCGTGKNTQWLAAKASHLVAVDFSEEMMNRARSKVTQSHVVFHQGDITGEWTFLTEKVDLVTCSLILEHIADLDHVFRQAAAALHEGGWFYIGELHPVKLYQGKKARFERPDGIFELESYAHHISDYFSKAMKHNFSCMQLNEWWDDDGRVDPRLVSFLFRKNGNGVNL